MSHVVVFNQSAKTVKIPTTPTTYLTQVRDEACQKFFVSKDQFTLKYVKPILYSDTGEPTLSPDITISPFPFHSKFGSQIYPKVLD
jgi:hypothetical protein